MLVWQVRRKHALVVRDAIPQLAHHFVVRVHVRAFVADDSRLIQPEQAPPAQTATPAAAPTLAELVCTRALAAGDQTQIEFTLEVLPAADGTQFQVQSSISSSVPDSDPGNDAVSLTFTVGELQEEIFANGFEGQ